MKELKDYIVTIPNFPKEGVMFRDVTSLLEDKDGLQLAINSLKDQIGDIEFDTIVGPESRGFIFAMPLAYELHKAFVPVRKKGKLPRPTISEDYALEYGTATLEICQDSIKKGDRVVIVDDLLATGGTIEAIIKLIEKLGGEVVLVCPLIELVDLQGRKLISNVEVRSCLTYEGE